jgi:hypothetical protein
MLVGVIAIVRGISQSMRDRNAPMEVPARHPGYTMPGTAPFTMPPDRSPGDGTAPGTSAAQGRRD